MNVTSSLSTPVRASYAFAHYGKSLFWDMAELLFAFYLAEIYGIDASVMGLLVFICLIWDAITDPLLGVFLARRNLSNRELLRMQFIGAAISSVSFCAVFFRPDMPQQVLITYALFAGLLFRTAYTVYDVPQNTLLRRLSDCNESRLTLSSLRVAGGALSTITIGIATASILRQDSPTSEASGFWIAAISFALLALISSRLIMTVASKLPEPPHEETELHIVTFKKTILRTDLLILFASVFTLSIGWPLFGKLIPFFASYVINDAEAAGFLFMTMAISVLLSQPLWVKLGQRISRISLIKTINVLVVVSCVSFWTLSTSSFLLAIMTVAAVASVSSAVNMLIWTRLADRLAEASHKGANDILAFGTFTFSSKLGLGVGSLILGGALTVSGYSQGQVMAPSGKVFLLSAMVIGPVVVTLIATGLMFYESRWRKHSKTYTNNITDVDSE